METNEMKNSVPGEQSGEFQAENGNSYTPESSDINAEVTTENTTVSEGSGSPNDLVEESSVVEHVDFSDEEAILASHQLGDEDTDEEFDHSHSKDFAGLSKAELIVTLKELVGTGEVSKIKRDVEGIKVAFYKKHKAEVEKIRKEFIDGGGNPEAFMAPIDNYENELKEYYKLYRDKKSSENIQQEKEKEKTLELKLHIIEEIKTLVDSQDNFNEVYNKFRDCQKRWRDLGAVPQARVNDLYENYNFAVEQFYDFLKINKELRELEYKKNYEAKLALCAQAEALLADSNVVETFKTLQRYHELWREIGPVAHEVKDVIWERFRDVSSQINKRHQDYYEILRSSQKQNLDGKVAICEKIEEMVAQNITSHKEWNKRSNELVEFQKQWKTIGFAPRRENNKVYDRFRKACDAFFAKKRDYYSVLKREMEANEKLKIELCEQAEALKDSTDWKKTTESLIALQKRWKEIGQIPRKHSDEIWKRFRAACDAFFMHKSENFKSIENQFDENLTKKQALVAEIVAFIPSEHPEENFKMLKDFQRRWSEIGFVPIKEKDKIQTEYRTALNKHFEGLKMEEADRNLMRYKSKIESIHSQSKSDYRVRQEREKLFVRIKQLESDIHLWENNIGFFAKSKSADALVREVNLKIEKAKSEIKSLVEKVRLIDSMDDSQ